MTRSAVRVAERIEVDVARRGDGGERLLRIRDDLYRAGSRVPAGQWLAELDEAMDALQSCSEAAGRGTCKTTMAEVRGDAARLRRCFVRLLRGVDLEVVAEAQKALSQLLNRLAL